MYKSNYIIEKMSLFLCIYLDKHWDLDLIIKKMGDGLELDCSH